MSRKLRTTADAEWERVAQAVLDHHFDMHEHCGDWCRRKDESMEQRSATKKYYRSMQTDEQLYHLLSQVISRFITPEKLKDIAHGMDTNANESFNNTVTWFAPKNKVYCGSMSLTNRISMAIGITSVGFLAYFQRLFAKLGIAMTPNVLHFLRQTNKFRLSRLAKLKTLDKKKERNTNKHAKLVEHTRVARKERYQRAGIYRRGMNLDGDEEQLQQPTTVAKRKPVCQHPFCGLKGHVTTKSKKCKANPQRLKEDGTEAACAAAVHATAQAVTGRNDDADDMDAHDAIQFRVGDDWGGSNEIFLQDVGSNVL
jgi:hypothetical protein